MGLCVIIRFIVSLLVSGMAIFESEFSASWVRVKCFQFGVTKRLARFSVRRAGVDESLRPGSLLSYTDLQAARVPGARENTKKGTGHADVTA